MEDNLLSAVYVNYYCVTWPLYNPDHVHVNFALLLKAFCAISQKFCGYILYAMFLPYSCTELVKKPQQSQNSFCVPASDLVITMFMILSTFKNLNKKTTLNYRSKSANMESENVHSNSSTRCKSLFVWCSLACYRSQ